MAQDLPARNRMFRPWLLDVVMASQSRVLASRGKPFTTRWPALALSLASVAALGSWAETLKGAVTEQAASSLAKRIPQGHLPMGQSPAGIIVLGGSSTRVKAALELAERYPDATLLLSGPGTREVALAQAAVTKPDRLIIDRQPKNTYDNALYSREFVGQKADRHWILVTSALHMPRAYASFVALDLTVVPWPVNDTPVATRQKSPAVWHEVFGLLGYWAMGRTQTLFPDPPGRNDEASSVTARGVVLKAPPS